MHCTYVRILLSTEIKQVLQSWPEHDIDSMLACVHMLMAMDGNGHHTEKKREKEIHGMAAAEDVIYAHYARIHSHYYSIRIL